MATALTPAASAASVTAPSPSDQSLAAWTPYLKAQAPLDRVAQQIAAAGPSSSFTSVGISVPQRTVTVYWKGRPSSAVSRVATRARATGIQVLVRSAKYSNAELVAREKSIAAAAPRYRSEGYQIRSVGPRQDGSGLDVGVERLNTPTVTQSPAPTTSQLATQLGPDVRIVPARHNEATDRFNDYSPHWAGARIIRNDGAERCTSGWPVRRDSDGRTFILTANHCGGSTWWAAWHLNDTSSNNTYKFGDVWDHITSEDVETIRSIVGGDTYDGGVKIGTESNKPISGAALGHVQGLSVCQSGSYSGIRCGLKVTGWDYEWLDAGYFVYEVLNTAGTGEAAAKGDSGGPVFTLDPNNSSRVIARGLQSAGEGSAYTAYNNNGEALTAFHDGGFTDIQAILSDFGDSIVTG